MLYVEKLRTNCTKGAFSEEPEKLTGRTTKTMEAEGRHRKKKADLSSLSVEQIASCTRSRQKEQ